jgi:hypothetical protein
MIDDPFSSANRARENPSMAERQKAADKEHNARRDAVTKRDKEAHGSPAKPTAKPWPIRATLG